jgi:hypothetical protein
MEFATCSIEFSFDDVMYSQINGLGMGNILSSILANIFVGHCEEKIFSKTKTFYPLMYKRYMDDIFSIFANENQCNDFFKVLNSTHPSIQFTFEKEFENKLPFLDVLVEKSPQKFLTTVYRKPTFAGQYLRWDSFSPIKRKLNLIDTLTHRATMICSKSKLNIEILLIRRILENNGYPSPIVDKRIRKRLTEHDKPIIFGPKKCPVYLKLPYLGNKSETCGKTIRAIVHCTFNSVNLRLIFSTRSILPASRKDVLPVHHLSNIVYKFTCKRCDCAYIGKTTRRLEDRIHEHVPKPLRENSILLNRNSTVTKSNYNLRRRNPSNFNNGKLPSYVDSAIGMHLLENPSCGEQYNDDSFEILAKARTKFHLNVLEAIYINTLKPILCRQKEFVYHTKLFHK